MPCLTTAVYHRNWSHSESEEIPGPQIKRLGWEQAELIAQEAEWVSDQVTTPKRLGSGEREDFLWLLQREERGTISWRERKSGMPMGLPTWTCGQQKQNMASHYWPFPQLARGFLASRPSPVHQYNHSMLFRPPCLYMVYALPSFVGRLHHSHTHS